MLVMYSRILILIALCCFSACRHVSFRSDQVVSNDELAARLKSRCQTRKQLSGLLTLRATGLKRFLGSVDIDVVAQAKNRIYLGVRSFFGSTQTAFASDGIRQYIFDLSDVAHPRYVVEPLDKKNVDDVLLVPITPEDLVSILLGNLPNDSARLTHLSDNHDGTFTLLFERKKSEWIDIVYRVQDDAVLSWVLRDENKNPRYQVHMRDFRRVQNTEFAFGWDVIADMNGEKHEVRLRMRDADWNGELFGNETFILKPP